MLPSFFDSVLQLIIRTSTDLPPDVRAAMKTALGSEPEGTRSSQALTIIAQNIDLACNDEGAICQDTGMPTFEVHVPLGANQIFMRQQIREAVAEATRRGKLRPNSVDSITGKNSGDNLGPGTPIIQMDLDPVEIGRNYPNTIGILSDVRAALEALADSAPAVKRDEWLAHTKKFVDEWRAEADKARASDKVPMRPERVCREISRVLPQGAVLVCDTGHSGIWSGAMVDFTRPGQRLIRCAGSLGWGFPGALGVKSSLMTVT